MNLEHFLTEFTTVFHDGSVLSLGIAFLAGLVSSAVSKLAKLSWLRKSIQILNGFALLYLSFYFFRLFSYYQ